MFLTLALGFVAGAVVSGVVFIVFYKNNLKNIDAAREEILKVYQDSPLDEAVAKAEAIWAKYFG
jgi:CHASE3 domain sensor protein